MRFRIIGGSIVTISTSPPAQEGQALTDVSLLRSHCTAEFGEGNRDVLTTAVPTVDQVWYPHPRRSGSPLFVGSNRNTLGAAG